MAKLPYQVVRWNEEEAEVVAATQKRKMLYKTIIGNLDAGLSLSFKIHLAVFAAQISRLRLWGIIALPVNDTMSGNQFQCKNK